MEIKATSPGIVHKDKIDPKEGLIEEEVDFPEVEDTLANRIRATIIIKPLVIIITKPLIMAIIRGIIIVPSIEVEDAGDAEIIGAEVITSPKIRKGLTIGDFLMEAP